MTHKLNMDNKEITIVSNSTSTELYNISKKYYENIGIKYELINGEHGKYGLDVLIELVTNVERFSTKYVIYIDDDCFITDTDKMLNLVQYMELNNFQICGMPDGGVISHRFHNPVSINMFFTIINLSEIRKKYHSGCLDNISYDDMLSKHLPQLLIKTNYHNAEEYNSIIDSGYSPFGVMFDNFEPYYSFFFWALYNNFNILYLNADDVKDIDESYDNLTTVLYDHNNFPFAYHSWFSREFNGAHNKRICALDKKCVELIEKRKTIKYSIIIPHKSCRYQYGYRLRNLLKILEMYNSLDTKLLESCEIIIVEQDSESRIDLSMYNCNHVFVYNPTTFNKSWGYNVGTHHALGDIIIFHDNDIIMELSKLTEFINHAVEHKVLSPYIKCNKINEIKSRTLDHTNIATVVDADILSSVDIVTGGVFSIHRDTLFSLGLWDENFVGWGGEDDALLFKMYGRNIVSEKLSFESYHLFHASDNSEYNSGYIENCKLLTPDYSTTQNIISGDTLKYYNLYNRLLSNICNNDVIIIVGAQRSGTTFISKSLAYSLGYYCCDEVEHMNDIDNIHKIIDNHRKIVIQAPALTYIVQDINGIDLIIYVTRKTSNIIKSEKRVGWGYHDEEKNKYFNYYQELRHIDSDEHVSELKSRIFNDKQKALFDTNHMTLKYEDMVMSPLYVQKEKRENFQIKQTSLVNLGTVEKHGSIFLTVDGITCAQTPQIIEVFNNIIHDFDTIIEIGTWAGGLTKWLYSINNNIYSYDIFDWKKYDNISQKVFTIGDCFDVEILKDIIQKIHHGNRTLILCDGGNKELEFNVLSSHMKSGDVIMLHDYADTIEEFQYYAKKHKWAAGPESHFKNINTDNLLPYHYDKFTSIFWGSFIKT